MSILVLSHIPSVSADVIAPLEKKIFLREDWGLLWGGSKVQTADTIDINDDGTPDGWYDKNVVETDEQGNKLYIAIIDQDPTRRCDEFYVLVKELPDGTKIFIGRCPYNNGRNFPMKWYTDQPDGEEPGKPDRFVATRWISRDDDDNDDGRPDTLYSSGPPENELFNDWNQNGKYDVNECIEEGANPGVQSIAPGQAYPAAWNSWTHDDDNDGKVDRSMYIYIQWLPIVGTGEKVYVHIDKLLWVNQEKVRVGEKWRWKTAKDVTGDKKIAVMDPPKSPIIPTGGRTPGEELWRRLPPSDPTTDPPEAVMLPMPLIMLSANIIDGFGSPLSVEWAVDESLDPEAVTDVVDAFQDAGVQQLAAELGGQLAREVDPDIGSSFSVKIPVGTYDVTFASVEKRVSMIFDSLSILSNTTVALTMDEFLTSPYPCISNKIFLKGNLVSASGALPANYTNCKVEINYYDVDYISKGLDESTLKVYNWTGTTWEELPSLLDTLNNKLTFVLPSLSTEFGVFGSSGYFSKRPIYLHAEGGLINLESPNCTQWHELYPYESRRYHLQDWEDGQKSYEPGYGTLSPSDQIKLQLKPEGPKKSYHIDEVTVTIKVTKKPYLIEDMYIEFEGGWDSYDVVIKQPNCTQWHEIYPIHSKRYHLEQWCDTNGDGKLSPSDQIKLRDKDSPYKDTRAWAEYHVDEVSTDIIVTLKPTKVKLEPLYEFPWKSWEPWDFGVVAIISYSGSGTEPIIIRPSYTSIYDAISLSDLTWEKTRDLMWRPLEETIIYPGDEIRCNLTMKCGSIAAVIRFTVAQLNNPEDIIARFINEGILESPFQQVPTVIDRELINFDVHNFHDTPVDNFELEFYGDFMPSDILDWYDPPGGPYMYEGIYYGGWGCPPLINSILDGTEVEWIDYETPLLPGEGAHFGLETDPYMPILTDVIGYWTILNYAPYKPSTPSGSTSGKPGIEYEYASITTDPEQNQISYLFDWGDGTTSGWIGPLASGATCQASHTWESQGDYNVKVKAKDQHGDESPWSEPLSISMPKTKQFLNRPFLQFLQNLLQRFPLLARLLQLPVFDKLLNQ